MLVSSVRGNFDLLDSDSAIGFPPPSLVIQCTVFDECAGTGNAPGSRETYRYMPVQIQR